MADHQYVSTACLHGLHQRCIETCKFCGEPCLCECEHPGDTDIALVERLAQAVSRLPNGFERETCLDIALQVVATLRDIPRSDK